MEITSFVLGVLVIVATFISIAIVAGMTKISKLTQQVQDLTLRIDRETDNIYRNMQSEHDDIWRQFEACGKDVTMVERTVMQRIDKELEDTHRSLHNEIEQIHKHEENIHREIDDTRRYIDSRIDKVVVKGSWDNDKQILKG